MTTEYTVKVATVDDHDLVVSHTTKAGDTIEATYDPCDYTMSEAANDLIENLYGATTREVEIQTSADVSGGRLYVLAEVLLQDDFVAEVQRKMALFAPEIQL